MKTRTTRTAAKSINLERSNHHLDQNTHWSARWCLQPLEISLQHWACETIQPVLCPGWACKVGLSYQFYIKGKKYKNWRDLINLFCLLSKLLERIEECTEKTPAQEEVKNFHHFFVPNLNHKIAKEASPSIGYGMQMACFTIIKDFLLKFYGLQWQRMTQMVLLNIIWFCLTSSGALRMWLKIWSDMTVGLRSGKLALSNLNAFHLWFGQTNAT